MLSQLFQGSGDGILVFYLCLIQVAKKVPGNSTRLLLTAIHNNTAFLIMLGLVGTH